MSSPQMMRTLGFFRVCALAAAASTPVSTTAPRRYEAGRGTERFSFHGCFPIHPAGGTPRASASRGPLEPVRNFPRHGCQAGEVGLCHGLCLLLIVAWLLGFSNRNTP